jgi:hypothetical protein
MPLNDVPLAAQTLGATQAPIRANFASIDAAFAIDHVAYTLADQGKHNKVSLPIQAASPATAVTEVALFSRTSPLTHVPELCIRKANSGVVNEFTSCLAANIGWTRLPSGILLKWGSFTSPAGGGVALHTFPLVGAPAFTTVYSVSLSTLDNNVGDTDSFMRLRTWTNLTITAYASYRAHVADKTVSATYLAIGI